MLITFNGFDNSYLPFTIQPYLFLLAIILLTQYKNMPFFIKQTPWYLWVMIPIVALVNTANTNSVETITASFAVLITLVFFLIYDDEEYIEKTLLVYSLVSVLLGILYFAYKDQFTSDYLSSGFERTRWMDSNYYCMVLGMGVFTSAYMLLSGNCKTLYAKAFYYFSVAFPLTIMIMIASRGGLLAVGSSFAFLFFTGKYHIKYKVLGSILLCSFLLVLYKYGYFELLEYRIYMEDSLESGSGRTDIWKLKIQHYNDLTLMEQVFGIGYKRGLVLGSGNDVIGFHSDYVAFLVEYGIVGLIMYIVMLISPIIKSTVRRRETIAFVIYMVLSSLTLEPITGGLMSFFLFYIPILLLSRMRHV